MKTAVSISDNLFKQADDTAKTLKVSRSELYQMAIEKFISEFNENNLLKELNQTYEKANSKLDRTLEKMQHVTISRDSENESW
jgi:metal-responsive CopG/Arc/MetJ family transcriptional regulator